jgi:2',3'-cyclic-nucleotide 2'-phosphodiesterase (5'-nucleotidase family)
MIVRRTFLALLSLAPWLASLRRAQAAAASTRLTFVLTNDIYVMGDTAMPDGQNRGGFARLAAVVKAERAQAAADGRRVIFAHGGDTLSPSLMSALDHGAHIVALTNLLKPDIFAPGNHEFDFGKSVFFTRMAEAKFPIYAANLIGPDGVRPAGVKDRSIIDLGGIKVGLTGAAYEGSHRLSTPGDLKFGPTVETMREQAAALRRDGADFVVAVMHADRPQTFDLAARGGVDLILTGHTHDLLLDYDGQCAMVESSYDAHYVTAIDINISATTREGQRQIVWQPRFRIIDTANVAPDPEMAAAVAGYQQKLDVEMNVTIATTAIEIDSRVALVRTRETTIGNLVADAMRSAMNADAAVMNGGGIRGGHVYAPGSAIHRRDVLAELPFGNRIVAVNISGRDLAAALENGFTRWPNVSGRFPQVSGLTIEVDPRRPVFQRIVSIKVGGAPLEPDRIYRVATNDFVARGGDGYDGFRNAKPAAPLNDAPPLLNAVMDYLGRIGRIENVAGGRIIMK